MKIFLLVVVMCAMLSCGSTSKTKLTAGGKNVRVLNSKKSAGCQVVDKVVGESDKGSLELAKNHAMNLTAKADGNAVYYDEIVHNGSLYKVYSTAFNCN